MNKSNESEKATSDVTPKPKVVESTPSASPSASVEEKIDKSKYKIKILNGSGIEGEAGKLSDLLKFKEYNIDSVGNANFFDFEETEVQFKISVPSKYIDSLLMDLKKDYAVIKGDVLTDDDDVDVLITVGTKKAS